MSIMGLPYFLSSSFGTTADLPRCTSSHWVRCSFGLARIEVCGALASCSCGSLATWSLEVAPWGSHPGAAEFTMELRDVGISWVMFLSRARQIGELSFIDNFMADISRYVGMAPNWGENLGQTYIFAFLFHQINMVVKKLEHYPNWWFVKWTIASWKVSSCSQQHTDHTAISLCDWMFAWGYGSLVCKRFPKLGIYQHLELITVFFPPRNKLFKLIPRFLELDAVSFFFSQSPLYLDRFWDMVSGSSALQRQVMPWIRALEISAWWRPYWPWSNATGPEHLGQPFFIVMGVPK